MRNIQHHQVHPTQNRPHSRLEDDRGITLRQHFAGQIMAALVPHYSSNNPNRMQVAAKAAVEAADALCQELANG